MREAARLGDRIVIMSPSPGRVTAEVAVDIERPRRIDSPAVSELAGHVTDRLREEVLVHVELDDKLAGGGEPALVTEPTCHRTEHDGKLDAVDPDLTPEEVLAVDAQLDDRSIAPVTSRRARRGRSLWLAVWPKVAAIAIALGLWQLVVESGWRKEYVLPAPATVFKRLGELIADGTVSEALKTTGERALVGFTAALVIGVVIGALVASSKIVRSAVGALITGLQTMPSIAWFPLAILLFQLSEQAITFVVVLGAAPSIANGLITGVDHAPPLLLRAGQMMGANRWQRLPPRPAPRVDAELRRRPEAGLGVRLAQPDGRRTDRDPRTVDRVPAAAVPEPFRRRGLIAMMIVILVVGIVVDSLVFGTLDRAVRRRHGMIED